MQAFIGIPSKADWHIGNNIHTFTFLLDYKFLPIPNVYQIPRPLYELCSLDHPLSAILNVDALCGSMGQHATVQIVHACLITGNRRRILQNIGW